MVRLFVSINVPIEIKNRLVSFQRKTIDLMKGSFTPVENLHLTLKFFGEVDEDGVERVKSLVGDAVNLSPFFVEVRGVGAFPSDNYVRVVWVGVGAGKELLAQIKEGLDDRLDPLGFKDAETLSGYVPHITLAKVKSVLFKNSLQQLIRNNRDTNFGTFRVEKVSLMKSELRREGAVHSVLEEFELG